MSINLIGVGYWKSYNQPHLPDPGALVDEQLNLSQINEMLVKLNNAKKVSFHQIGYSWCRFRCGVENIGNQEMTNGKYIWPEGLAHYVKDHNIKLPIDFLDSITNDYFEVNRGYIIDYNFWIDYCESNKISTIESFKAGYDLGYLSIDMNKQNDPNIYNSIYIFLKEERMGLQKDEIFNFLKLNGKVKFVGRFYKLNHFINEMKDQFISIKFTALNSEEYLLYKSGILSNGFVI